MSFNIIVDTCYWIALFDPAKDPENSIEAERIAKEIEEENIIIPYPTLYEFVNSRLSRKTSKLQFEMLMNRRNIFRLDDGKYKNDALENFFIKSKFGHSDVSLVDEVIKLIISDSAVKIEYIVSFDQQLLNDAMALGIKKV
jgi:predicted nucleic acid-binding protein